MESEGFVRPGSPTSWPCNSLPLSLSAPAFPLLSNKRMGLQIIFKATFISKSPWKRRGIHVYWVSILMSTLESIIILTMQIGKLRLREGKNSFKITQVMSNRCGIWTHDVHNPLSIASHSIRSLALQTQRGSVGRKRHNEMSTKAGMPCGVTLGSKMTHGPFISSYDSI